MWDESVERGIVKGAEQFGGGNGLAVAVGHPYPDGFLSARLQFVTESDEVKADFSL